MANKELEENKVEKQNENENENKNVEVQEENNEKEKEKDKDKEQDKEKDKETTQIEEQKKELEELEELNDANKDTEDLEKESEQEKTEPVLEEEEEEIKPENKSENKPENNRDSKYILNVNNEKIELKEGEHLGIYADNQLDKQKAFIDVFENIDSHKFFIDGKEDIYTIGVLGKDSASINVLTIVDNLDSAANLSFVEDSEIESRINNVIKAFSLEEEKELKAKVLSPFKRKCLDTCIALISKPDILFVYESTLDLKDTEELFKLIAEYANKNSMRVIYMSSNKKDNEILKGQYINVSE